MRGKFIVIDGADGSGKATQTNLLVEHFRKEGKKVETIDFPRYYDNFFGKFTGQCLAGDYGDFISLDPHIASVMYAADRWESSQQIKKWLEDGAIVIADRYASSNQIHQGSKIKDEAKRKDFLAWLEKMEFEVFKIPKPDLIIYLEVPAEISAKLIKNKSEEYTNGKKDLAEENFKHQQESRDSALKLLEQYNNWIKINCVEQNKLKSIEEIHQLVKNAIKNI